MSPYALTVINGIHNLSFFVSLMLGFVVLLGAIVLTIHSHECGPVFRKGVIRAGCVFLFFGVLSALCPSATQLRDAYIMTEVAKVATADNAKATAEVLLQRIDKLLELQKDK